MIERNRETRRKIKAKNGNLSFVNFGILGGCQIE